MTAEPLYPFDRGPDALPLLGQNLSHWRKRAIEASGIDPDRVFVAPGSFAPPDLIRALDRAALAADVDLYPAVGPSPEAPSADAALTWTPLTRPPANRRPVLTLRQPVPAMRASAGRPLRGAVPGPIAHWLDLAPVWQSVFRWRRAELGRGRRRNAIHPGAAVHPSARIDGSIIDDGAEIAPRCDLRDCYVGRNARLSDRTQATGCIFEAETLTLVDGCFENVICFGQSSIANLLLRNSVIGRRCFVTSGVIFWTEYPPASAGSAPQRSPGVAVGDGSTLGARTIIAPGLAIPPNTTIVMRAGEGTGALEATHPQAPHFPERGGLTPAPVDDAAEDC